MTELDRIILCLLLAVGGTTFGLVCEIRSAERNILAAIKKLQDRADGAKVGE